MAAPAPSAAAKKHARDSKSRFNLGVIYLKTGDYPKARENLLHSLYCHICLHGASDYSDRVASEVAAVREKLGDCYARDPEAEDKAPAVDHYVESRRLLRGVDAAEEGADVEEALERLVEKINDPDLLMRDSRAGTKSRPVPVPEIPMAYLREEAAREKKRREASRSKKRVERRRREEERGVAKSTAGRSAGARRARMFRI